MIDTAQDGAALVTAARLELARLANRKRLLVLVSRLPVAPSTNALNTNTSTHKRRVKSKDVIAYESAARRQLRAAVNLFDFLHKPGDHYKLTLVNYFDSDRSESRSDADNRIKAAQDSIAKVCGFNDSYVTTVESDKSGVDPFESYTLAILERYADA